MNVTKLLDLALEAVDCEIEAVLERPSRDVLWSGERVTGRPAAGYLYRFNYSNPSFRFAEKFKAYLDDGEHDVVPGELTDKSIELKFPKDFGNNIPEVSLEWENDFILRKVRDHLDFLQDRGNEILLERIERLFFPGKNQSERENGKSPAGKKLKIKDDGSRNASQRRGIEMAVREKVSFIWGPPGTGKTSTLGFIIANLMNKGKKVLLASNTNRAVDIGVISTLEAVMNIQEPALRDTVTRFGEAALQHAGLETVLFEKRLEKASAGVKEKAERNYQMLEQYRDLQEEAFTREREGKKISSEDSLKLKLLKQKIEELGGENVIEEGIEEETEQIASRILKSRKLVATTLARVCTSDLLSSLKFDALVVDEASMANLPYLIILAAKTKSHMVMIGDPMQLPPIALTTDKKAKSFLEQDIFAFASNAKTTSDLFVWHDENPHCTGFFDTQYRLNSDMADIISQVFYDGRLKSDISKQVKNRKREKSMHVINSAPRKPFIISGSGNKGFNPLNEVHTELVMEMVEGLTIRKNLPKREIGVIVPFRSAAWELRKRLIEKGYGEIEVGTIHTFQGREKLAIIFDTVMSGEVRNGRVRHYSVRPFDEAKNGLSVPRLLNVAFSRSRENLYVIGDMNHIRQVYGKKFLGKLLSEMIRPDQSG